jgi:D-alanine-D-alanine ligase
VSAETTEEDAMKRRAIRRRVGVIMGGSSAEREISLRSGHAVAEALSARGHDVVRLALGDSLGPDLWATLQKARIDVAFIALHGRHGEDGCVQGLLELARIPYTGSSVLASALSMDKLKAKELFRLHNVPTPPYYMLGVGDDLSDLEGLHGSFGFPVVVKPKGEGSSIGISRATSLEELRGALQDAFSYDDEAIVERFVGGTEIHVGILDGEVLGAIEIAHQRPIYDYESKYGADAVDYFMPTRLSPQRERGVLNLAERAARALGCTGAVRVDLLVTSGENEYVLEVNTLPGLTPDGLLSRIAASKGYEFADLCEAILDSARLHQPARRRSRVEPLAQPGYAMANGVAPAAAMKSVG